ncbi:hypothetical protein BA768_04845 [Chryseobacterium sp. CBo1]|uniref:hypothetical protein n=1 Tax=Chryseobacterium sp. CBo1 TaxID=1869230 RepID=UPI0008103244|nr:hypothetical protein [Chryseobacterium sp. CBo1]OCK50483.1 hypothetical protein BA768_04845 [Chryseobacterium sp. CBo1]
MKAFYIIRFININPINNDDVLTKVYDNFDFDSFKKDSYIYHILDGFSIKEIEEIEQLYTKNKKLKGQYPTFITPEIVDQINTFVERQLELHQKGRTENGIKRRH